MSRWRAWVSHGMLRELQLCYASKAAALQKQHLESAARESRGVGHCISMRAEAHAIWELGGQPLLRHDADSPQHSSATILEWGGQPLLCPPGRLAAPELEAC